VMCDEHKEVLRIVKHATHPRVDFVLKSMVGKGVRGFEFFLKDNENLLVRSHLQKQIFVRDSISEIAFPYIKNLKVIQVIDKIIDLKMIAVVPIIVNEKCLGVLLFGARDKSSLTQTEEFFLSKLSEQIGVYLQQAWLIKLLKDDNETLRKRNHDLSQIVKIKRSFLYSLAQLMKEIPDKMKENNSIQKRIENHLKYLQSLLMVSQGYVDQTDEKMLGDHLDR